MSDFSASLSALEYKVRSAATTAELAFVLCNDTRQVVDFRIAALVSFNGRLRTRLAGHSGLADVEADSPYALWLAEVADHLKPQLQDSPPQARLLAVEAGSLPKHLGSQWDEWMPAHIWAIGLAGPDGIVRAILFMARDAAWPSQLDPGSGELGIVQASHSFGHAWWALAGRRPSLEQYWQRWVKPGAWKWALAVVLFLLLVPIKEYVLVPVEIVSTHTQVVSSPRDGVIRRMTVLPNSSVKAGQTIAELDDTTLYNRLAVAQAALSTARIESQQASQRAIETQAAKSEMNLADGRLQEKEVEVESINREIDRLSIKAPAAGVVIYSDPDDWAGKPVQTGERVGVLADPTSLGVQAWVPVGEAINLTPGAPMTIFLRVAPLSPLSAKLDYASYQVIDSPQSVASYLLRGHLTEAPENARIGLRGTARITGNWTVLGYLMFRRPFAAAREWCGC